MIQTVKITLANYRCFADTDPLRMEFTSGFTALVGPNNSGKSSLLRFFIENRPLFGQLLNPSYLNLITRGVLEQGASFVEDSTEIHCDLNDRRTRLELEFLTNETFNEPRIAKGIFYRDRDSSKWTGQFFANTSLAPCYSDSTALRVLLPQRAPKDCPAVNLKPLNDFLITVLNAVYIPPFRNAISENASEYYDMAIGSKFVELWHSWATGGEKAKNNAIIRVQEDIERIFGLGRLEVSATPDMKALHVTVDRKPYKLREMGAGLSQFILVLGNVAIRKPAVLLIDEPELNLHPSLQVDFLTSLASYTSEGCVIFATHNMGLARAVGDRILSFRKSPAGALVRPFEELRGRYAEFAGAMAFSAFRDLGNTAILLVEGPTDVKVVHQFLRLLKKDHTVVVLQLGGRSMIRAGVQQELSELTRLSDHIFVLVDSERTEANQPLDTGRETFLRECRELGFTAHATDRRATENYFTSQAISNTFGSAFQELGPYGSLRDAANGWSKQDNWRIARNMSWADIETTDVGVFLQGVD